MSQAPLTFDPNEPEWKRQGRQSYHYQTVPDALKQISGWEQVVNDPNADPQAWAQQQYAAQRAANPTRTDQGDAGVFSGGQPTSQSWQQTGQPQSATQQWNAQSTPDPRSTELYDMLRAKAQQSLNVDRNDPVIRAQADAYSANEERASRNYLADLAESEGQYANLRGEQRMAAERVGQRTGAFEAGLMGQELMARRNEVLQYLTLMGGQLSAEQQISLQRDLAAIEAELQRAGYSLQALGMAQQGNQFNSNLAFSREQLEEQRQRRYQDLLG